MKKLLFFSLLLFVQSSLFAQYTTTWIANTYGDNARHVGNCARSMWVSPGGLVYAASGWDENSRNIGIYQNGLTIGGFGGTKDAQGSAIGGDSSYIYVALETPLAGQIGRYSRTTLKRDLAFQGSTGTGDAVRGIVVFNNQIYASDFAGNRIAVFNSNGTAVRNWTVTAPGALTLDSSGYLWVANMSTGTLSQFDLMGNAGTVIQMGASSHPSALYYDNANTQLMVGDQGPDMNIKIYGNLSTTPSVVKTFGALGGYLNTTNGTRGQTGDKRFTRIVGIGKDVSGKIYVLNNPWGGTWDLGRNGATDIHCYGTDSSLLWTLQALNFEGNAAADPETDGVDFYSGNNIYSYNGTDGGAYKANTVDPYRYPYDARIQLSDPSRGEHFAMHSYVNGHHLLMAMNQNADIFYSYYFNAATDGYIAIPGDTIIVKQRIRNGFDMDSVGDLWTSLDKTLAIQHYPLTGFATNGKPIWGTVETVPTPASIRPLNRLAYLPSSDRMILAGGSSDWTLVGDTIQVYNGWKAGNKTTPNVTIDISKTRSNRAKSIAAAGDYLFVAYYAIPNIDIFDLATGNFVLTMTSSNSNVYVGNDVDSEYGIRVFRKSNGEYLITKDDYNGTKIVIHRWTPALTTASTKFIAQKATCYNNNKTILSWATGAESNVDKYLVQKSINNGATWTTVGTIKAANKASGNNYQYEDLNGQTKVLYSIKAIKTGGTEETSAAFSDNCTEALVPITAYPSITTSNVTVKYSSKEAAASSILVFNTNGECLYKHTSNNTIGLNQLVIPSVNWLRGLYLVRLQAANGSSQETKFFKQ